MEFQMILSCSPCCPNISLMLASFNNISWLCFNSLNTTLSLWFPSVRMPWCWFWFTLNPIQKYYFKLTTFINNSITSTSKWRTGIIVFIGDFTIVKSIYFTENLRKRKLCSGIDEWKCAAQVTGCVESRTNEMHRTMPCNEYIFEWNTQLFDGILTESWLYLFGNDITLVILIQKNSHHYQIVEDNVNLFDNVFS